MLCTNVQSFPAPCHLHGFLNWWSQPLLFTHKRITWSWRDGFLCDLVTLLSLILGHHHQTAIYRDYISPGEQLISRMKAIWMISRLSFFGYYVTRPHQGSTNGLHFSNDISKHFTIHATFTHSHTHSYTDDGCCHARRQLLIRSNLGFSILLKDTSTCS